MLLLRILREHIYRIAIPAALRSAHGHRAESRGIFRMRRRSPFPGNRIATKSTYNLDWLRDQAYSGSKEENKIAPPALWDSGVNDALPETDFSAVNSDTTVLMAMLRKLRGLWFRHRPRRSHGPGRHRNRSRFDR